MRQRPGNMDTASQPQTFVFTTPETSAWCTWAQRFTLVAWIRSLDVRNWCTKQSSRASLETKLIKRDFGIGKWVDLTVSLRAGLDVPHTKVEKGRSTYPCCCSVWSLTYLVFGQLPPHTLSWNCRADVSGRHFVFWRAGCLIGGTQREIQRGSA